jgi:tetratricopeptide (TPR) repeat protein
MRYFLVTALAVMGALGVFLAARHYAPITPPQVQAAPGPGTTEPAPGPTGDAASTNPEVAARREFLLKRVDELHKAIAERPRDLLVHLDMGAVQLLLGRVAEARTTFRHALELEPTCVAALYGVAECSRTLGDYPEALKCYLEIRKLRPDDPGLDQRIQSVQSAPQGARKQP